MSTQSVQGRTIAAQPSMCGCSCGDDLQIYVIANVEKQPWVCLAKRGCMKMNKCLSYKLYHLPLPWFRCSPWTDHCQVRKPLIVSAASRLSWWIQEITRSNSRGIEWTKACDVFSLGCELQSKRSLVLLVCIQLTSKRHGLWTLFLGSTIPVPCGRRRRVSRTSLKIFNTFEWLYL